MASGAQMTGMCGVYLAAAELSRLGFIVSPTSRSAAGADLLVTDQECQKAWSVQVKTNKKPVNFWLVGAHGAKLRSPSHAYVFVNLHGESRPEFVVASSLHVAEKVVVFTSKTGSVWYSFMRKDRPFEGEGWDLFGNPYCDGFATRTPLNRMSHNAKPGRSSNAKRPPPAAKGSEDAARLNGASEQ